MPKIHLTHCCHLDPQQDNASAPHKGHMNALATPTPGNAEMEKCLSQKALRQHILPPLTLDRCQFQLPLSSSSVAKTLKGGPDVIWSSLANVITKTLLRSIWYVFLPNATASVQSCHWSRLTQECSSCSLWFLSTYSGKLYMSLYMSPTLCTEWPACYARSFHSQVQCGSGLFSSFNEQVPRVLELRTQH